MRAARGRGVHTGRHAGSSRPGLPQPPLGRARARVGASLNEGPREVQAPRVAASGDPLPQGQQFGARPGVEPNGGQVGPAREGGGVERGRQRGQRGNRRGTVGLTEGPRREPRGAARRPPAEDLGVARPRGGRIARAGLQPGEPVPRDRGERAVGVAGDHLGERRPRGGIPRRPDKGPRDEPTCFVGVLGLWKAREVGAEAGDGLVVLAAVPGHVRHLERGRVGEGVPGDGHAEGVVERGGPRVVAGASGGEGAVEAVLRGERGQLAPEPGGPGVVLAAKARAGQGGLGLGAGRGRQAVPQREGLGVERGVVQRGDAGADQRAAGVGGGVGHRTPGSGEAGGGLGGARAGGMCGPELLPDGNRRGRLTPAHRAFGQPPANLRRVHPARLGPRAGLARRAGQQAVENRLALGVPPALHQRLTAQEHRALAGGAGQRQPVQPLRGLRRLAAHEQGFCCHQARVGPKGTTGHPREHRHGPRDVSAARPASRDRELLGVGDGAARVGHGGGAFARLECHTRRRREGGGRRDEQGEQHARAPFRRRFRARRRRRPTGRARHRARAARKRSPNERSPGCPRR